MNFYRDFWKVSAIFTILVFAFVNPFSRAVIVWLLPLGSGWDDLVEIVLIVGLCIWGFAGFWSDLPRKLRKFFRRDLE
jgi:hypothetical protein